MILNASEIGMGSHIEADLLIIGGGAAGITIAREFAGTSHKVILLESGGEELDERIQALYAGDLRGLNTEPIDLSRLRYFGGTTNHWAGWCHPLESWDFERRADWPESGWPVSREDLDPYYRRAMGICELGPYVFDDPSFWRAQDGGDALLPLPSDLEKLRTAIFQISPPTRFAEAYGPELREARNIRVMLDATALELMPSEDSHDGRAQKRIGHVRVATMGGNSFTVSGRATVLAMGGIETARLLLLSDKVHASGTGNEFDLAGRYFMDHPWISESAYLHFNQEGLNLPLYFDEYKLAGTRVFGVLSPARDLMVREQIGGFRLWLRPTSISPLGNDSIRTVFQGLRQGEIVEDLTGHIVNIVNDFDILADSAYKTLTRSRTGIFGGTGTGAGHYRGASIDLNFEQRPNRDSRVLLGDELDAFGQRRVALDWRLSETDRQTAMRAIELAASEFGRMGIGRTRLKIDLRKNENWPDDMTGSRHHSGTARMARDPKQGVVNADCRVHSVDNLFIAGSAVFPTTGFANPTLTITALSLRLADHLREVLA